MIRRGILSLLEHPQRGIAFLFVLSCLPFFGWVSTVVLALFCLRWTTTWSVAALAAACVGSFLQVYFWYDINFAEINWLEIFMPILYQDLPIFILATVWRITVSLPIMLYTLAAMISVGVFFIQQYAGYPTTEQLQEYLQMLSSGTPTTLSADDMRAIDYLRMLLPTAIMLSFLSTLFLARWLQAILFYPGGFAKEFQAYHIERPFAVACIVLLALILFLPLPLWVTAIFLVWLSLPAFAGVALIHAWVKEKDKSIWWLVGFYVSFLLALQLWPPVLLTIAIIDSFYNWRHRWMSSSVK